MSDLKLYIVNNFKNNTNSVHKKPTTDTTGLALLISMLLS